MGWASAGYTVIAVVEPLIDEEASPNVVTAVVSGLIEHLLDSGQDVDGLPLAKYADRPAVVEAFARNKIFLRTDPRHPEHDPRWT